MKHCALFFALLTTVFSASAQNPFFDQQFSGFQVFFEATPQPNQAGQISVRYPACRRPYVLVFPEFPTETQLEGTEITLTYAFWIPNSPGCFNGWVQQYALPVLPRGNYRLKVNARYVVEASSVPARIVETRTMAQINLQVGESLETQVPNLTPVGFALMSLMMLGVGAFVSGRRH